MHWVVAPSAASSRRNVATVVGALGPGLDHGDLPRAAVRRGRGAVVVVIPSTPGVSPTTPAFAWFALSLLPVLVAVATLPSLLLPGPPLGTSGRCHRRHTPEHSGRQPGAVVVVVVVEEPQPATLLSPGTPDVVSPVTVAVSSSLSLPLAPA